MCIEATLRYSRIFTLLPSKVADIDIDILSSIWKDVLIYFKGALIRLHAFLSFYVLIGGFVTSFLQSFFFYELCCLSRPSCVEVSVPFPLCQKYTSYSFCSVLLYEFALFEFDFYQLIFFSSHAFLKFIC